MFLASDWLRLESHFLHLMYYLINLLHGASTLTIFLTQLSTSFLLQMNPELFTPDRVHYISSPKNHGWEMAIQKGASSGQIGSLKSICTTRKYHCVGFDWQDTIGSDTSNIPHHQAYRPVPYSHSAMVCRSSISAPMKVTSRLSS